MIWPQVKAALNKAAAEYKTYADRKRATHKPFQVGDQVYLSTKYIRLKTPCKKLGPQYLCPFRIRKVINPVTVVLQLPPYLRKIHPIFHSSLLKPIERPTNTKPPGPVKDDHYKIDGILDSRVRHGGLQYLVKWKGYPLAEASWVAATDLNATKLLKRYHETNPQKPGSIT